MIRGLPLVSFSLVPVFFEQAFAELVPKPGVEAMATEITKRKDGGKGLDVSGLPVPPSVAIDLSACQVRGGRR